MYFPDIQNLRRLARQHGWQVVDWRLQAVWEILRPIARDDDKLRTALETAAVSGLLDDADEPGARLRSVEDAL